MLADITLGDALAGGMFIIALIALYSKSKVKVVGDVDIKQPLTVELAKKFADKHDFERHVEQNQKEYERLANEIKKDRQDNQVHVSERQRTLFNEIKSTHTALDKKLDEKHSENSNRMNSFEKSIGGLEKVTDLQNQKLLSMDQKLDRLIERRTQ